MRLKGLVAIAGLVAIVSMTVDGSLSNAPRRQSDAAPAVPEFVSLIPACACGGHTVVAAFALSDGRRLRTMTTVTPPTRGFLSLSGGPSGEVLMTASSTVRCSSSVLGCGPVPDTCRTHVSRLVGGRLIPLFTEPDSVVVDKAVASPDRRRVVMLAGPCTQGSNHLVVRDLASGRQWSIGADLPHCDSLGLPAWSYTGLELLIPYGSAPIPRPGTVGAGCPTDHITRLAIMPALRSSRSSDWKLIAADHGCIFEAGTFDPSGIAAIESCSNPEPTLGRARLLQINQTGHVTRMTLQRGWEEGAITTEPNGQVLISQDQPANQPYPERDWVWEFDGRHLRLVHRYPALDAAEIIAIPYQRTPVALAS